MTDEDTTEAAATEHLTGHRPDHLLIATANTTGTEQTTDQEPTP